jgi:hypothetical protein
MVGLALKVSYDGKVKTEFGFQSYMEFRLAELEPVLDGSGHWGLPFRSCVSSRPLRLATAPALAGATSGRATSATP